MDKAFQGLIPLLEGLGNIMVFLLTTEPGWILIAVMGITYLGVSLYFRLKPRQEVKHETPPPEGGDNRSSSTGGVPRFLAALFLEFSRLLGRLVTALPTLLAVLLIMGMMMTVLQGVGSIQSFVDNQKEIARLEKALDHLQDRYKVAHVTVTDQRYGRTTLEILYYNDKGVELEETRQVITLPGRDIFFDSIVINFDFTEIEDGRAVNMALPYRVFSEETSAREGVVLHPSDSESLPYIFEREDEEIYGLTPKEYREEMREIMDLLSDPQRARERGVRTFYGNAVHRVVQPGDELTLWIEQTGGIVIKEDDGF